MTSSDTDPDERTALENLVVVKEYVKHEGTWLDPQAAKDGALKALDALYDQIDWIEKGIVEWRRSWVRKSKSRRNSHESPR